MSDAGQRSLAAELEAVAGPDSVLCGEPMKNHTTFRIGGPADYFIRPHSADEIVRMIAILKSASVPYFVMGNGSNLLVSDDGYRGAVISIGKDMSDIRVDGTRVFAQAGAKLSAIAAAAQDASLAGFEFAGGIPGTLGGACVMNAGAFGGEMKQVLRSVTCITEDGGIRTLQTGELELGYRSSIFMKSSLIAAEAVIQLEKGDPEAIAAKSADLKERRCAKQPLDLPSAGSAFKRPEGYFAGKLIMDAGLRGYRVGGAQVSEKHCGFIVNIGDATAADVRQLIRDVQDRVMETSGVMLQPEIRFI